MSPTAGKASGGSFQCVASVLNQPTCLGYDAAGNLTNYTAPGQYAYDPENRLQSTAGTNYTYDAEGNRVLKNGSTARMYWYGAGNVIAEADGAGNLTSEYVYVGGKRITRIDLPTGSTHYYLSDHLNSTSMVVNSSGVPEEESDYSPFGTEYVVIGPGSNNYKFTGKERDTKSQLDYFGARYYSSAIGCFGTADWSDESDPVPYADLSNPQTLNLHNYVTNNPETFTDEDGHKMDCTSSEAYGPDHIPVGNITTCVVTPDPEPPNLPASFTMSGMAWGHHGLPGWSKLPQNTDAYKFFSQWRTGPLENPESNLFDQMHRQYNKEVLEKIVEEYLKKVGKKEVKDLSKEEIKQLARAIMNSNSQGVRSFFQRLGVSAAATLNSLIDRIEIGLAPLAIPAQSLNEALCGMALCRAQGSY